ncbi:MAG: sulfite exporter TauE/SafE family protein [Bacteriovoracaceae bacterium]
MVEHKLLLLTLVTFGSFITSLTGLGGGSLILAGLLLLFPPEMALPLHSFTQLTANGLRAGLFFKSVHWRVVGAYAAFMLPFAWVGAEIFHLINPSALKILVGSLILISILPLKIKPIGEPHLKTFVFLGGLSGFLGIFVGAVGPMVTPFFNRLKVSRDGMISTKSAGQMFLQLSKILAFSGAAGINFSSLQDHIGILVFGSLVGVGVSIPISRKISDNRFNQVINILLAFISIKILLEGIRELFNA